MNRHLLPLVAALLAAALTTGLAAADDGDEGGHDHKSAYAVGLWGDVPYSDDQTPSACPT